MTKFWELWKKTFRVDPKPFKEIDIWITSWVPPISECEETFLKTGLRDTSGTSSSAPNNIILRRNAVCAISQQMSKTNCPDIRSHKTSVDLRLHPLNYHIRRESIRWFEEEIEGSRDAKVNWSFIAENKVQSFAGCFVMIFDKAQRSVAAEAVIFCFLHWNLLNLSEQTWWKYISSRSTIIAEIPFLYRNYFWGVSRRVLT